ncbi:MAG: hypothetical protein IJ806_08545 [Ruminococcus sp.]|nr:hypothetical protein [Ruminococcus sp.]
MFDKVYFDSLQRGSERMAYLKNCITEADNGQDHALGLELRHSYIAESIFGDDNFSAIIMFPEYAALYDKHPDLHDRYSFMFAYKWILEDLANFPQVGLDKGEELYGDFFMRCEKMGYSPRVGYMKKAEYLIPMGKDTVMPLMEKFRAADSDELSDGRCDEMCLEIKMQLEFGSEQRAVELLKELDDQGLRSTEGHQRTYGVLTEHFARSGCAPEADHYADLMWPMINGHSNYLMEVGFYILTKSITGLSAGLRAFRRHAPMFFGCKNPRMCFYFADAAHRLFENFASVSETVELTLPSGCEIYQRSGTYSTAELSEYFRKIALGIAQRFDAKFGTGYYMEKALQTMVSAPDGKGAPQVQTAHFTRPADPVVLAIPFPDTGAFPDNGRIVSLISSIDGFECRYTKTADELGTVNMDIGFENGEELDMNITPISYDQINFGYAPRSLQCRHFLPEEVIEEYVGGGAGLLMVTAMLSRGQEGRDRIRLLKAVNALDTCGSRVVLNLGTAQAYDIDWVKLQSGSSSPLMPMYDFTVMVDGSTEPGYLDMRTTGLGALGMREISALRVREENADGVYRILCHIAEFISLGGRMRDAGEKQASGIVYDKRRMMDMLWYPAEERVEDCGEDAAGTALICFDIRGREVELSDLDSDELERLELRKANVFYQLDERKSRETVGLALKAFIEGRLEELIIGFDVVKDGQTYGAYLSAESCMGDTIAGTLVNVPAECGLEQGDRAETDIRQVFFWRAEMEGSYIMQDEAFLLGREN